MLDPEETVNCENNTTHFPEKGALKWQRNIISIIKSMLDAATSVKYLSSTRMFNVQY